MNLKKYLTNKDLQITNEDFDLEKLEADIRKGYTKDSDVQAQIKASTDGMVSKKDFDNLQKDYTNLKSNFDNQTKMLNDTNERMAKVNFESKLTRRGFQDKDFEEVTKIRQSVFGNEKDDNKAIEEIAKRYEATYFPKEEKPQTLAPNEAGLTNKATNNSEIKITRNTRASDLLIRK